MSINIGTAGWSIPRSLAEKFPSEGSALERYAARFVDVPQTQPFYAYVEWLACQGAISGYTCGGPGEPCDPQSRSYYRPGGAVTRGQTAKIGTNAFFPGCATGAAPR